MPRHFTRQEHADLVSRPAGDRASSHIPNHLIDLEAQVDAIRPDDPPRVQSPGQPSSDLGIRRPKRSRTANLYRPKTRGRLWKPGQEPGIDPAAIHLATTPSSLKAACDITVVDFSQDDMRMQYLDNASLEEFLDRPQEDGLNCRWININGLSWDVISIIGKKKNFHRLAIEDMLNLRNRTKADWYSDHTYMVLPLQKLVHLNGQEPDDSDSETELLPSPNHIKFDQSPKKMKGWIPSFAKVRGLDNPQLSPKPNMDGSTNICPTGQGSFTAELPLVPIHTLQRYHGGANEERTQYMERASPLTAKSLAVSVEQVSIFLSSDNCVVSFFEQSAQDIEDPIVTRLSSPETVLRRCADASMVVQAIIDAIIDLAIPVTRAYQDTIDELELNVLTEASMNQIKPLYIITSEVSEFRANVFPITNLINALRDHKSEPISTPGLHGLPGKVMSSGVTISSFAHTYLGDVEDHIVLITGNIDQMRRAADNMIDLIFNTISAFQNESMKQLTLVTIFFLPMSFLTGYFGQNFKEFPAIEHNESYFWTIAVPLVTVVSMWLFKDVIRRWVVKLRVKRIISKQRKSRGVSTEGKFKRT